MVEPCDHLVHPLCLLQSQDPELLQSQRDSEGEVALQVLCEGLGRGNLGGAKTVTGVDRPGVHLGGAGVGEREAGQCLDRALTEFLPFLWEPSSSPHPRVRRSRGRLLSVTAQGVWEGARRSRLCRIMGTSQPAGLGLGF